MIPRNFQYFIDNTRDVPLRFRYRPAFFSWSNTTEQGSKRNQSVFVLFGPVGKYLYLHFERAGVVVQIALVNAKEKGPVAGRGELTFAADVNKIVVIIAH